MDEIRWAVKHAPKTWQELITPRDPKVKNLVETLFTTGKVPTSAILLYGLGGTGKTKFTQILAQQPQWYPHILKTDGETKSSLDGLRNTLWTVAPGGKRWLVIINEIEKSTNDFIDGLRSLIDANDERSGPDKFLMVFTDNHFSKLVQRAPEVFDGERVIDMDWGLIDPEDILLKCIDVLKKEGKDTVVNRKIASTLVATYQPKLRKILNELQLSV